MSGLKKVFCLDENKTYYFKAVGAPGALNKMKYCLDIQHKDKDAHIDLCNGRTLALTHSGKTYASILDGAV